MCQIAAAFQQVQYMFMLELLYLPSSCTRAASASSNIRSNGIKSKVGCLEGQRRRMRETSRSGTAGNGTAVACTVKNAKFLSPARPGDTVSIEYTAGVAGALVARGVATHSWRSLRRRRLSFCLWRCCHSQLVSWIEKRAPLAYHWEQSKCGFERPLYTL